LRPEEGLDRERRRKKTPKIKTFVYAVKIESIPYIGYPGSGYPEAAEESSSTGNAARR
jgi:hypothetical protein